MVRNEVSISGAFFFLTGWLTQCQGILPDEPDELNSMDSMDYDESVESVESLGRSEKSGVNLCLRH